MKKGENKILNQGGGGEFSEYMVMVISVVIISMQILFSVLEHSD